MLFRSNEREAGDDKEHRADISGFIGDGYTGESFQASDNAEIHEAGGSYPCGGAGKK